MTIMRLFGKLVLWIGVLLPIGIMLSCMDDELAVAGGGTEGETLVVSLPIELEETPDAVEPQSEATATRLAASSSSAFDVYLGTGVQTRAGTYTDALKDAKPTKLASVQVLQIKNGAVLSNKTYTNVELGRKVDLTLTEADDCELVVWVKGASGDIGNNWNTYEVYHSTIKNITAESHISTDGKMPYLLHLKNVKVVKKESGTAGEGIIQSPAGKDVRLRLRRLPARLNVTWNYNVTGYTLQSIHLHNFPAKFVAFPSEIEQTYPNLLSLFTYRIATAEELAAKHLACWIPRNVRGTRNIALPTKRGKNIAPTGSTYVEFTAVATDVTATKKKLIYRIYLGGNNTSDFNVRDNTNYWYHIDFKHTNGEEIIRTDDRVEYLNGRSAAEDNNNIVPTANCFMIEPGGAFAFDPYTYRQNGVDIDNLKGNITAVKLLWQIKEDGDVGEPTMGIANSSDDHTNIVDIRRKDGSEVNASNPLTAKDQGYIYCRVPNTRGGSGVIAAYNGNTIVAKWHVWVTNYHPDDTGNETVLNDENKRKMKYVKGAQSTLPFMDRNLGAQAGFTDYPVEVIDKSKAAGFHYVYGNKDPLPSSYSYKTISGQVNFSFEDGLPPENILNLYQPDGVSYYARPNAGGAGNWNSTLKPTNDPCPAGWRVPSWVDFKPLFDVDDPRAEPRREIKFAARGQNVETLLNNGQGGCSLRYDDDSGHYTYYRMTGYQPERASYFQNINTGGNVVCREGKNGFSFAIEITSNLWEMFCIGNTWNPVDAHTVRCIQEKE